MAEKNGDTQTISDSELVITRAFSADNSACRSSFATTRQ